LDIKATHEWLQLAAQTVRAQSEPSYSSVNVTLEAAAEREPQSPATPAYRLWTADNLARDGRYADAIASYDRSVEATQSAVRLVNTIDPIVCALYNKAQAAALDGNVSSAIVTYEELGRHAPDKAAEALFHAGLLAEGTGQLDRAAEFYRTSAGRAPAARTDNPAELARRALQRLEQTRTEYASDPYKLVDLLATALERGDASQVKRLASTTHFAAGPVGGHTAFEDPALLDELCSDLLRSQVAARRRLLGSGAKLYLPTRGWKGKWFVGDVMFIITRAPRGWQWTGLAVTCPNDLWLERWRPPAKQTNQPLPFELFAPWPANESFTAGGLNQYVGQQLAIVAAGFFGGALLAFFFSRGSCGFGPRGYYYNQWPTHDEDEAFAIDFTRYRQYVPYDNESGGTPVLAARAGIVSFVQPGTPSGDSSASNTVEIQHADPGNPANLTRFTSRYLHLEGPFKILVSPMMPIFLGNRIGRMDDTGNSILDHLHFSIHDRNIPYPNVSYGASVRPTPMSGVRLEDGDSNTCVRSTNVEYRGEKPMKEVTTFAGQNWLITPAATAANQAPPNSIQDQKWLLVLSGVGIVDLKGISPAQWLHETVSIRPNLLGPLQYAINRYAIPTPPGTVDANYWVGFQVEQWAPFAALSSMFNKDASDNSGFAVDVWRPNPFAAANDFANTQLTNLFAGIQVDVAVRDSDAWLYRLSYNITLLGKIVFGPIIIT
jgi:murein DD-endopeptidase MepM/ murein hydrolase activator NlpD